MENFPNLLNVGDNANEINERNILVGDQKLS